MQASTCSISGQAFPLDQLYPATSIRPDLYDFIRQEHPAFGKGSLISLELLNTYRKKFLFDIVEQEMGELSSLENKVMQAIKTDAVVARDSESKIEERLTVGQRVADQVAAFGGSWTFISFFFLFILLWMGFNTWLLMNQAFDPYPYILLNLILSCLAAIQAPVIMMSQNRKEAKDRFRAENDYMVNLKAELEIKLLHEKMDYLLIKQNQHLLKIQQIQADYLEDILRQLSPKSPNGSGKATIM